ncbi:sigma-70 family rna polymerase sigma factor : Uncultured bacterium genome assembly Metasoil_fosmids_resub OS=uncultured bacterium PE=4 SV=1: Sigma70_r2: Sigma70_r4_2: WD40: WD40 [Gemmata massiliana]|uniref:Uncharacterized protein n=1 Tax=Gemmata massiliana TaxID=1210884 RepID=A0A6P2D5K9_9BACT|nr:sigma-70 family RNA polymerase sigma factor [Gemmata massiliana]VTR94762.1 sigma-70 family rna polymerase sigma factor : Uncultured bacterium genome assembly Metasoil_fosmids_resub OS=uncultured bacterium PE=4 SV=1: Sigma70_r2: Sigma70_r4_2: WD40: WD40 [Gemmata massiliana]
MPSALRSSIARVTRVLGGPAESQPPTDGQLLTRFVERADPDAFAELARRHGPMVHGVCRRALGRRDGVDDAFQAAFLVLVRRADTVRPREAVGNWLYGVATRTARAARTKAARRGNHETPMNPIHEPAARDEAPPEETGLLPFLDREIERLPERYRVPVVLCELEGRSRGDVARQLGIPEGTLSSRLAYARKILAARLKHHAPGSLAVLLTLVATQNVIAAPRLAAITLQKLSATGTVSTAARTLAEDVVKGMFLSKLKVVSLTVLALTAAMIGRSGGSNRAEAQPPAPLSFARTAAPVPKPLPAPKEWVLGKTWVAQPTTVNIALFSPDGKRVFSTASLVSAGAPGQPPQPFQQFREWNAVTGKLEREFREKEAAELESVAFTPDRKRGASGTKSGQLVVWDEIGGKPVRSLATGSRVWAVALAPDGKWAVTGGDDGAGRLWDVATGKEQLLMRGHVGAVRGVAISPDGKTIATGSEDEKLHFWDAATGKLLRQVTDAGSICGLTYTPDGKKLLSGTGTEITVRDAVTGKTLHTLGGCVLPGCGVPLSSDGKLTAGYGPSADKKAYGIIVSDVTTGKQVAFLTTKISFRQVTFSPDGTRLVVSGSDEQHRGMLETWVLK